MEKWNNEVIYQLTDKIRMDGIYQELLMKCCEAEKEYADIMQKLTPEEQSAIEEYIALCEELAYRFAQIAYQYGLEEKLSSYGASAGGINRS